MAKRIRLVRHSDRTPISGTANERKKKEDLFIAAIINSLLENAGNSTATVRL